MIDEMPLSTFLEWQAFDEIEPLGNQLQTILMGQLVTLLSNVYRGKNQSPFKLQDFLPHIKDQQHSRGMSWSEMKQWARNHNARLGIGK